MSARNAPALPLETPILALFRQWEDRREVARREDFAEDVRDKAVDDMLELERAMIEIPSTRLEDFVAKLLADTSGGDFYPCEAIVAEAKALIGARD